MTLTRPVATLRAGSVPGIPSPLQNARISRFLHADGVAANEEPAAGIASVKIEDGRIEVEDSPAAGISAIDAVLSWPRLSAPMRFNGSGSWRGEAVRISAEIGDGRAFFAGRQTRAELTLESAPANIVFSGTTEASAPLHVVGALRVSAPSLKRALAWSDSPAIAVAPEGAFALTADLASAATRLKLDNVSLSIEDSLGNGAIEFDLGQDVPLVAGTLAFGDLDFTPFVPAAIAPTIKAAGDMPAVETHFSGPFVVDLRLSAERAKLGPVAMTKAAATLNIRPEIAAFDLSDASALGGSLQAGFRTSQAGGSAEVSFFGNDIDAGLLADILGTTRFRPSGRATIAAMIRGPASDWRELLDKGEGTVSVKLVGGSLDNLDLAGFMARLAQGGFFGLGETIGGSLPFQEAEFRAAIGNGLARIEKFEIVSHLATLSAAGIAPLPGRGLAMSGVARTPEDPADGGRRFFIGGSWSAPFFSSASSATGLQ
ncbi:MAG: hypothetical protein IPL47_01610 [Phyllobacteriaceae bacterium]|nr:hypothetical protein [Phyllobacteriaceae bacterium]